MTDHHEEFAAGKIEEQLDTLLQADDAMSSSLPQHSKRLVQDLRTLTAYTTDKQADQASIERVLQRLQQRGIEAQGQRSHNYNNPSLQNPIDIKHYQQRQIPMQTTPSQRGKKPWIAALVAILIIGLFIGLLVAFLNVYPHGTPSHPGVIPTSTPNQSQSTDPSAIPAQGTATPVSEQLPAVQTSCPATGTARAAVMPAMPTASQRGILYLSEGINNSSPVQIKRYDVTTSTTTTLFTAAPSSSSTFTPIVSPLLSADKQWLAFTTSQNDTYMLHLMRADGKELQTLYCTSDKFTNPVSWSPNQHYLILSTEAQNGVTAHLTLIDLTSGIIREILDIPGATYIQVVNWVGDTGIYVSSTGGGESVCGNYKLSLLSDVTKDSSQQESNLQAISLSTDTGLSVPYCQKYYVSPDSSQLLIDSYIGRPSATYPGESIPLPTGPSRLSLRPIAGGNAQTINDAPTHNIINAGFITNSKIWFMIRNPATNNGKNGLWMMNTDGSGLVCLWADQSSTDDGFYNDPNLSFTQDIQDFAVSTYNNQQEILTFGSTSGGTTTTFATTTGTERLTIIGWT